MRIFRANGTEIFCIILFPKPHLQIVYYIFIFFFKHFGKDTILRLTSCIILFIMRYFINKEQGQNFYPFIKQFPLPFNMGKDRFPDLDTPQLFFTYLAGYVTSKQFNTVDKGN